MTSEPEKLLPVIQADREAAATHVAWIIEAEIQYGGRDPFYDAGLPAGIRRGIWDEHEAVQAFARHRLSSPVSGTDGSLREADMDWLATAKAAGKYGIRYSTNARLVDFINEVLSASPSTPIPVATETLSQKQAREVMMPQSGACASQGSAQSYGAPIPVIAEAGEREAHKLVPREATADQIEEMTILADACLTTAGKVDVGLIYAVGVQSAPEIATPATLDNTAVEDVRALRIDWNKFDLAEAYDLVEGVRRKAAQPSESPTNTALCAALDAIEAADCEWDGLTAKTEKAK